MSKSELTHVCDLPPGQWRIVPFGDDAIILACPDHPPLIYKNGKLEILKPEKEA